ncbi:MAG: bifunctional folylpolyglutamate synthase/dihydrofolate synthase [Ruminococcus sp.]|nr:bifunctional folylpolyglutamate synthase/dihydrofolate synthase [Ruminococcus sp.]
MTYKEAIDYLAFTSKRGSCLGLSRITQLLERLGNPHKNVNFIHVTGTNGKGSVTKMLSCILNAQGYKTGLFSSPFVTRVNESIQLDGNEISDSEFAELIGDIMPVAEAMDEPPTEFEITTAAAFEYFSKKNCDVAVIECGLGGDMDSTNVIEAPLLSVITNVEADHSAFLGDTIAEIASHKAGIIKKGCPVLFGGNSMEALEVISEKAINSKIFTVDYSNLSNISCTLSGSTFNFGEQNFSLSMLGIYQPYNAAIAISAVEILRKNGLDISNKAVYEGLKSARLNGRFELIKENPIVIFDGSHNPHGVNAAIESIKNYFDGKVVLLMGVMADKEYPEMVKTLSEVAAKAFTVKPKNPRALDSMLLADEFIRNGVDAEFSTELSAGVEKALTYAEKHQLPLIVLGSLYMYSEFMNFI